MSQLDNATAKAIAGNVGTTIAFQIGPDDAEQVALQLSGDIKARDLIDLPKLTAYIRLLIDGSSPPPFSMRTTLRRLR
jgi:hypothetical protein